MSTTPDIRYAILSEHLAVMGEHQEQLLREGIISQDEYNRLRFAKLSYDQAIRNQ